MIIRIVDKIVSNDYAGRGETVCSFTEGVLC